MDEREMYAWQHNYPEEDFESLMGKDWKEHVCRTIVRSFSGPFTRMISDRNISDPRRTLEVLVGRGWAEQLRVFICSIATKEFIEAALSIDSTEQAAQQWSEILERVPENEVDLISQWGQELSQDGNNVVFIGGSTPEDNEFYHLIGASHRNVGSFHFFSIPLTQFVHAKNLLVHPTEDGDSQRATISDISDAATESIIGIANEHR